MYSLGANEIILRLNGEPKNDYIWGAPLQLNHCRFPKRQQ
jgi:hypothetical protein